MTKMSNKEKRELIERADRFHSVSDFSNILCCAPSEKDKRIQFDVGGLCCRNPEFKHFYMQELMAIYTQNWKAINDDKTYEKISFESLHNEVMNRMKESKRKSIVVRPEIILENSEEARQNRARREEAKAKFDAMRARMLLARNQRGM